MLFRSPNSVICQTNVEFNVNDPIIFSDFVISGSSVSSFGGLNAGQVYYIAALNGAAHFTVANAPNSTNISLTTVALSDTTSGTVIDQKDVVKLTTATGSMTTEVNLPISPGQITGQQFTLYPTSNYIDLEDGEVVENEYGNLFTKTVKATIGTPYATAINRVVLDAPKLNDIYQVYNNMPIRLDQAIGGLSSGTTYYVIGSGQTSVTVTATSSTGNILTCNDTSVLYEEMPILFSGSS